MFGLLRLCLSEGLLLGALFSYIIQGGKGGWFSLSNKGFVLPPVYKVVVSAAVFVTELAEVLCVVLVQSRSLSGRHVSTSFLDPVLGAMMKQVCRQTQNLCLLNVLLAFVWGR